MMVDLIERVNAIDWRAFEYWYRDDPSVLPDLLRQLLQSDSTEHAKKCCYEIQLFMFNEHDLNDLALHFTPFLVESLEYASEHVIAPLLNLLHRLAYEGTVEPGTKFYAPIENPLVLDRTVYHCIQHQHATYRTLMTSAQRAIRLNAVVVLLLFVETTAADEAAMFDLLHREDDLPTRRVILANLWIYYRRTTDLSRSAVRIEQNLTLMQTVDDGYLQFLCACNTILYTQTRTSAAVRATLATCLDTYRAADRDMKSRIFDHLRLTVPFLAPDDALRLLLAAFERGYGWMERVRETMFDIAFNGKQVSLYDGHYQTPYKNSGPAYTIKDKDRITPLTVLTDLQKQVLRQCMADQRFTLFKDNFLELYGLPTDPLALQALLDAV